VITSADYFRYWGKAQHFQQDGDYHLLVHHSLDVAAVAKVILDQHPCLLTVLSNSSGIPHDKLVPWLLWAVALHDVGKFSRDFQTKVPELYKRLQPDGKPTSENTHHSDLGYLFINRRVAHGLYKCEDKTETHSQRRDWLASLICATTGHHGLPATKPSNGVLAKHFSKQTQADAAGFCDAMTEFFGIDLDVIGAIEQSHKQAMLETSWLIAGLCVLSDWLGSHTDYFEYQSESISLEDYWQKTALPCAQQAVAEAGVLPAAIGPVADFSHLFPDIAQPTQLQNLCNSIELAEGPNFLILEDLTGSGKTEAALTLAGRLIAEQKAHGLYIGLPTQATANAMYSRTEGVYDRFFAPDQRPSLTLAHSAQHLHDLFREPINAPPPTEQNYSAFEETASAHCTQWIADSRKRALLADIGVGTIDQALLSVLHAKHQSLRVYGLMGKVLIIDEVHAYDPYMEGLMSNLIHLHTHYGGHTVLLSATLATATRADYIRSFAKATQTEPTQISEGPFPLMTHVCTDKSAAEHPVAASQQKNVPVQLLHNPSQPLQILYDAHSSGHSGCWIRNTVDDAIAARQRLIEMGVPEEKCLLLHSRFCLADRLAHEQQVLQHLGKNSTQQDRAGYVVIGTQVLQESLDFDADCMVSDLAPIDLLIQRAGRRMRHMRDVSGNRATEEGRPHTPLYVLTPPLNEPITTDWCRDPMPGTAAVYRNHGRLWKTATLLADRKRWTLPEDARFLIESVYDDQRMSMPEALEDSHFQSEGDALAKRAESQYAKLILQKGYSSGAQWDVEEKAATRLTEEETETVFLARWVGEELEPLIEAPIYPWDLSSLKLRASQVPKAKNSAQTKAAIERAKARAKRLDTHSMLIPLGPDEEGRWRIESDQQLHYSPQLGFLKG
jgi:CRISPR-associated endonuclease/helicase Cas3